MTPVPRSSRDVGCARSGSFARRPSRGRQRPNMPRPHSCGPSPRADRPLAIIASLLDPPAEDAEHARARQLAVTLRLLRRALDIEGEGLA